MIKRIIPISKQILFSVKIASKILQIQQIQFPNQHQLFKAHYNFCSNKKISLVEGINHIRQLQSQVKALNDLEAVFGNQLEVVQYLDNNLQKFDDKYMRVVYVEEILVLNYYQIAIYTYIKQEDRLNKKFTQKLLGYDLQKEIDIIKDYKCLEPKEAERLRIKVNSANILCQIINYGVEADINQLHEWMNDFLDQLDLNRQLCLELLSEHHKVPKNLSLLQVLSDQPINFYMFVAQIHRKRNLMEEFERFLYQGIEEAKSHADKYLPDPKGKFEMELILMNFFELLQALRQSQDVDEKIILNFALKIVEFGSKFWENSIDGYIQDIKVGLTQFFMFKELHENAANLLNQVFEVRDAVDSDNTLFLLYSNIYFCKKNGYLKDIDIKQVLDEADELEWIDLDHLMIQVLDFNMCIFKDALEEGNLDKIKFRFDKVIYYIQELLKLININSYLAVLPIFNWIDDVITSDILKNNEYYILNIYNTLNLFKDINLDEDRQNLEKDFYLIVLTFKLTNQLKIDFKGKLQKVENFVSKYISSQNVQNIALEKLLLFILQLKDEGQLDECEKVLDSIISLLQHENQDFQKFIQQFQNQKKQVQRQKKQK